MRGLDHLFFCIMNSLNDLWQLRLCETKALDALINEISFHSPYENTF